jgi:hypothetical protein
VTFEEPPKGRPITSLCGQKKLSVGQLLRVNPGEVAGGCQNVLLCSQDRILPIACEKSFANSKVAWKQGDSAGCHKEKHHEME